jgi:glycogenin glucosyltransferase
MSKFAYVTFIIRNDSYLPGALVFAYALRLQKTEHDLVCIVSENVSNGAINALKELYDEVLIIDEVFVPHNRRQERQDRPYLFSRFNAFRLGKDGDFGKEYEKIIIADCDVLPLRNYDSLFLVDTPAGIINEKKEYCMTYENGKYIIPNSVFEDGSWIWHQIYKDCPHGSLIPREITDRVNQDASNMGVNASLFIFEPSMELYNSIIDDVLDPEISSEISVYNWPEMQYITKKLSGKWHNIDLRYSSFNGYPMVDVLYGIHFAGLKPWNIKNKSVKSFAKFRDYKLWFYTFEKMMKNYPRLHNIGKLRRLNNFILEGTKNDPNFLKIKKIANLEHFYE